MMEYDKEELQQILKQMKEVSSSFYYQAINISPQCHTFIEFCGLMNEFIKICDQTMRNDIDFTKINTHSHNGKKFIVREHNKQYLLEKLNCIFDNCFEVQLLDHPTSKESL